MTMRVVGSMSLNQMASDPRATNGSAKVEDEARVAFKDVGVEGLIDQPTHQISYLRYDAKNRFALFGFVHSILTEKSQIPKQACIITIWIFTKLFLMIA